MPAPLAAEVEALRRFNRFYTRRIGVLEEGLLGSGFSLTEARLIYEIATRDGVTAALLARELGLDPGYLSRTIAGLAKRRILERARADGDARRRTLVLGARGREAFARLDAGSSAAMAEILAPLAGEARRQLLGALARIAALLGDTPARTEPYLLRPHRPGDMGWIIRRHAELYHQELGWDASFEAFVADIAAAFLKSFDATRDCCWIAEQEGDNVGSVCLVKVSAETAKLRLLLVEPRARGLGIGARLVAEALAFARRAGYAKVTLWTNDSLHAARRLYERAGFVLIAEEPYRRFGRELVGQTWQRLL